MIYPVTLEDGMLFVMARAAGGLVTKGKGGGAS